MDQIRKYYIGLWSKSFSLNALSNWHQHLKGIFAGCTVSIILFLAGRNVIIEYTNTCNAPNFVTSSKTTLPLIRAFMDDINLMSESGVQMLLSRCSTALKWAGMDFRCDKSRSIVIIKGKTVITDEDSFQAFHTINSCHANQVLGRIIDGSISDKNSIDEIETKLLEGLSIIDKSFFLAPKNCGYYSTC